MEMKSHSIHREQPYSDADGSTYNSSHTIKIHGYQKIVIHIEMAQMQ